MSLINSLTFQQKVIFSSDITIEGNVNNRNIVADGDALDTHVLDTSNPHSVSIDQVSPTSAKGDILVDNGSNVVSVNVGNDGQILVADTSSGTGIAWSNTLGNLQLSGNTLASVSGNINILPAGELLLKANPVSDLGACTKAYADSISGGLDVKESVRVKTVSALPAYVYLALGIGATTLTSVGLDPLPNIDGVSLVQGDRLLVDVGTNASHNGVYVVSQLGSPWILTRSNDDIKTGMYVLVDEGVSYANCSYVLNTSGTITVDTTPLTFVKFSGGGGILGSNVGTSGMGVFKQKNGNTMEFKKINSGSSGIVLVDDIANNKIDIDVGTNILTDTGVQNVSNKTITGSTNIIEASGLLVNGGSVSCSLSNVPNAGQVLMATGGSTAIWKNIAQYFFAYHAVGLVEVFSKWTDLVWDTEVKKDTVFTHANGAITFNETGAYIITVDISLEAMAGSSRTGCEIRIVIDTGSGVFVELSGTRAIGYQRLVNYGSAMTINRFVNISSGDKIKIQAIKTFGFSTIKTLPNGSRIMIKTA